MVRMGKDEAEQLLTGKSPREIYEIVRERVSAAPDASINDFARRRIGARMTEIDRFLPLAGADEKDDLIREKRRLAAELQALGRPRWKTFTSSTPPAIPS